MKIKFLGLLLLMPSLALADAASDADKQALTDMSTTKLAEEVTVRLSETAWYCGSDLAEKVYTALRAGKSLKGITVGQDPKCQQTVGRLAVAEEEVRHRTYDQKSNIDSDETFFNFTMTMPTKIQNAGQEAGATACLETARQIDNNWRTQITWPPLNRGSIAPYATPQTKCIIEQSQNESLAQGYCGAWLGNAIYDFKENLFVVADRPMQTKAVANKIDSGIYFFYSLQVHPGENAATVELRGVDGKVWVNGVYRGNLHPDQLVAMCSIKTQIDIQSTGLQAGKR